MFLEIFYKTILLGQPLTLPYLHIMIRENKDFSQHSFFFFFLGITNEGTNLFEYLIIPLGV